MQTNIFGYDLPALKEAFRAVDGCQPYRAEQVARWMYQRGAADFASMTDLGKELRSRLAEAFSIERAEILREQHSGRGDTSKFLLGFADNMAVETVVMRHRYGNSVCVSTQVGCAMGCRFCASTLNGVSRSLSAGEILDQVLFADRLLKQSGQSVNSIVIMGSGEPMANYQAVVDFIRLCHAPYCLNLSLRSVTISTVGLVPGIDKLAAEEMPLTLSISLHAADDATRSRLMPVNDRYPIRDVIAAGERYAAATGRRVTYEYTLIDGINDRREDAANLSRLLKGSLCHVNLIPVNPVPEQGMTPPEPKHVQQFAAWLEQAGLSATVRREMGGDIKAACGQLRKRHLEQQEAERPGV